MCIEHLLKTQWGAYRTALEKTNCKVCFRKLDFCEFSVISTAFSLSCCGHQAEQRRLLARGPPINISDAKALPCPDNGEVHSLWYMSDGQDHSAKLEGSLTGEVEQFLKKLTARLD